MAAEKAALGAHVAHALTAVVRAEVVAGKVGDGTKLALGAQEAVCVPVCVIFSLSGSAANFSSASATEPSNCRARSLAPPHARLS